VATGASVGLINARVYKNMSQTFTAYNTSGEQTAFDCEVVLRMGLYNGMNLSGDHEAYFGGGYEQVGINAGKGLYGTPILLYLEPDQTQWVRETGVIIPKGSSFGFESSYRYLGQCESDIDSYTRARVSYTNRKITNGGTIGTYECYFMSGRNEYDKSTAEEHLGRRFRFGAIFRGGSDPRYVAPRYCWSVLAPLYAHRSVGGSAQFLIE
jgi:hypothetical protein